MATITDILAAESTLLVGSTDAGEIERVAAEWAEYGFDADDVQEWGVRARVFEPVCAAELRDAGVNPRSLAPELGALYACGDVALDSCVLQASGKYQLARTELGKLLMPADYDADSVTREDFEHDNAITLIVA